MDYKVLYRKYRPDCFENILGQDYTINILKNSIINNKIAHAYIFNGPRGTGKTSTAKVFAKTINCENPVNGEACGKCNSCLNTKNNPDIIEIDAASNNGVDEIRELINNVKIAPSFSKYKVYIIDEVHMMTQSAFNALLLTLEEPPQHIVFILATTNIESVPITILSRCQKFDFRKIDDEVIKKNIERICEKENIEITEDAINEIAYLSEGGMRDALSILDQLSANNKKIDADLIVDNFGSIPTVIVNNIIKSIDEDNIELFKNNINKIKEQNVDYKIFIKKMIDRLSTIAYDTSNCKKIDAEIIKNIVFDLLKIINNYNINVNVFTLIELSLLEYIKSNKKIISQEIESKKITCEKVEEEPEIRKKEIISQEIKEEIHDDKDLSDNKFIRLNNCFVNAKKEFLKQAKEEINKIIKDNKSDKLLISMLADAEVIVASNKVYILSSALDSVVNLININYNLIEKKLNNIKVAALTEEEWIVEKQKYIDNLKAGIKYEMIEEKSINKKEEKIKPNKKIETIENIAEDIFSKNKIEVE